MLSLRGPEGQSNPDETSSEPTGLLRSARNDSVESRFSTGMTSTARFPSVAHSSARSPPLPLPAPEPPPLPERGGSSETTAGRTRTPAPPEGFLPEDGDAVVLSRAPLGPRALLGPSPPVGG